MRHMRRRFSLTPLLQDVTTKAGIIRGKHFTSVLYLAVRASKLLRVSYSCAVGMDPGFPIQPSDSVQVRVNFHLELPRLPRRRDLRVFYKMTWYFMATLCFL